MKVGDSIGAIYKRNREGKDQWELVEDKINKVAELKSGRRYYTRSKFRPLDADDIDINTEMQEKANGYIITKEVFGLNDITRTKAEDCVAWANEDSSRWDGGDGNL